MANIIDSFVVMLGFDTKGVKQGADETKEHLKKVEEEAKKTAEAMAEHGHRAKEFFTELAAGATEFFGVALSIGSLVGFVHHTLEAEVATGRLATMIGVSAEEMGVFANATRMFGGTAAEAESNIKSLAMKVQVLGTKMRGARMAALAFQQIGLSEAQVKGKNVFDVLGLISDKLSAPGMTGIKAETYGERLGLGSAMIRMLRDKEKMNEMLTLMRELGVATNEEVKSAQELEETQAKLGIISDSIGRQLMTILTPALKQVGEWLTKIAMWAKEHPEAIKAAFIGIAAGLSVLTVDLLIATAAALGFNVATAGIPILIGLIAAGGYYIYQEWNKWVGGTGSVLGKFFDSLVKGWNEIKDIVMPIFGAIREAFTDDLRVIMGVFEVLLGFITDDSQKMEEGWDKLWKGLVDVLDLTLGIMFFLIKEGVKKMIAELSELPKQGFIGVMKNTFIGKVIAHSGMPGLAVRTLANVLDSHGSPGSTAALAGAGGGGDTIVNIPNVTIQTTSTDPLEHGAMFADAVDRHLLERMKDFANGGQK